MTREEAIKLIDTHTVCFYNEIDSPTLQALHLAIEALSADTVPLEKYHELQHQLVMLGATFTDLTEVVRCKDCRWWNSETNGCNRNPSVEAWHETDFCKYGERQCNYFGERREE